MEFPQGPFPQEPVILEAGRDGFEDLADEV